MRTIFFVEIVDEWFSSNAFYFGKFCIYPFHKFFPLVFICKKSMR